MIEYNVPRITIHKMNASWERLEMGDTDPLDVNLIDGNEEAS